MGRFIQQMSTSSPRSEIWRELVIKTLSFITLMCFVRCGALPADGNPVGCTTHGSVMQCPLGIGTTTYSLDGQAASALQLVSPPGQSVQLDQVAGQSLSSIKGTFGEYCVYLDDFHTAQSTPGRGEVGCYPKAAAEPRFQPLKWGASTTALAVPPGSTLTLQGYVQVAPGKGHDLSFQFSVTVSPQKNGIISYRQPRVDAGMTCNGKPATTASAPWPNTSGRNLTLLGATVYALSPPPDAGCLYILPSGSSSKPRYTLCDLNQRGVAMFPTPVEVGVGERILAQASHTCAAPGVWDWAAYLYVY